MAKETLEEKIEKVTSYYGDYVQLDQSIEELNELSKLLEYDFENGINLCDKNIKNIAGEIADVLNMIDSLKIVYSIDKEEINRIRIYKMNRTKQRIKDNH